MMVNHRPRYHVVRIDSSWVVGDDRGMPGGAPDLWDHLDSVYDALEEEFGPLHDEEIGDRPWPAFDSADGTSWSRMSWPELDGVHFEPHPYAPHFNLLRTNPT